MAVLARFPIGADTATFRLLPWSEFPGALQPTLDGAPIPSEAGWRDLRLSSKSHWDVPVATPDGVIRLLASHPTPPVFDGPEDFNGKRNHDEIMLWLNVLAGEVGIAPAGPFVIAGDANLDPVDGSGIKAAIEALLGAPALQAVAPTGHFGTDTADWDDPVPGDLRVDYVLPSIHWQVMDSGVLWPAPDDPMADAATTASRHRLVWGDLAY